MSETQDIDEIVLWKLSNSGQLLTVNPILSTLVDGLCDKNCALSLLSGTTHILETIWNMVTTYWKTFIKEGESLKHARCSRTGEVRPLYRCTDAEDVAFFQFNTLLSFPKPTDLCINMMPFVMENTFEKCMLPCNLKPYWDNIINMEYLLGHDLKKLIPLSEIGKIGFLTIQESYVEEKKSQRRGGIHTESPGKLLIKMNTDGEYVCAGRSCKVDEADTFESTVGDGDGTVSHTHMWGYGKVCENELCGGIYMASNVRYSCEVWNCQVLPNDNGDEVIGSLGDVEHLREFLPGSEHMEENKMFWLTDRTPHESLPLETGTYRQYFRLVTSKVSLWFEEHSTKNPLGVVPDPEITKIVKGSKFV